MLESRRIRDINKIINVVKISMKYCDNSLALYRITGATSISNLKERMINGDVSEKEIIDELYGEYKDIKDLLKRDQKNLNRQKELLNSLPNPITNPMDDDTLSSEAKTVYTSLLTFTNPSNRRVLKDKTVDQIISISDLTKNKFNEGKKELIKSGYLKVKGNRQGQKHIYILLNEKGK